MLLEVISWGLKPAWITGDSWYSGNDNLKFIRKLKLSHLSRQCLDRRMAEETISKEALAWYQGRNNKEAKVDWQFTTADARIKLKKLYPVLIEKGQLSAGMY